MSRFPSRIVSTVIGVAVAISLTVRPCAALAGPEGSSTSDFYFAHIPESGEPLKYRLTMTLDRGLFRLLTLKDKYRVARILIENHTNQPLSLAAAADEVTFFIRSEGEPRSVKGILDLRAADGPLWDALSDADRAMLAYPQEVGAVETTARGRPQTRYVYVFIPVAGFADPPSSVEFKIGSLNQTLRLNQPQAAAR